MPADSSQFVPATSIDGVIVKLDAIVDQAINDRDRLGFFAVLYRTVTESVKHGIATGRFEDGPRMERLDVVFANRYLGAFHAHRHGGTPTRSWRVVFAAAEHRRPVIMQHLLLGMNAHINLDLAIAASEVCPGAARAAAIDDIDTNVALLAKLIARPVGLLVNFNLILVRLRETWDVRRIIEVLSGRLKPSMAVGSVSPDDTRTTGIPAWRHENL
jgi:uncharacterized protein DUF5995